MAYSGKYQPKNVSKYKGNANTIVFRSLWEYHLMKWLDLNPDVIKWCSEEVVIPYLCKTDGQMHRYFVDFAVEFKNGKKLLIEVKPKHQTVPPERKRGKAEAKFITEAMTYMKNESKWEAATVFAKKHGYIFQVWTEDVLNSIGIMTSISKYPTKRTK